MAWRNHRVIKGITLLEFVESEQWDVNFDSVTTAQYILPTFITHPNEFIWLFAVLGFIASPIIMALVYKKDGLSIDSGILLATLLIVTLACFALMYGMTPTP